MRLAVLGGSFDPVHIGHLSIAEETLTRFGYDRVLLVPTSISPLKRGVSSAPPEDRLAMLSAAILGDPRLAVEDCEILRGGVSYTIETIEDIDRRYRPEGKIAFILGEDLIPTFRSWRRVEDLVARVDLILAGREGAGQEAFEFPHRVLGNPPIRVSSTAIRRAVAEGGAWRYLVPRGVGDLIVERGLYGSPPVRPSPYRETSAAVDRVVLSTLSPSRYLHSRSVALLAADLCSLHGCDPEAGFLAGIAHDMCKEYPPEELIALASSDGDPISDLEGAKPSLLHARAAAQVLRVRFGVGDESILEAIRRHTYGASGMGPLAKIIYICDKIEPTRKDVPAFLRDRLWSPDLEGLFAATVEDTVRYLRDRAHPVSEDTQRLLDELERCRP